MLLKTSFDDESDEGSDCPSAAVSESNSANTASSMTYCTSGAITTELRFLTILSTRIARSRFSNSGASNFNWYSPLGSWSILKLPWLSVMTVTPSGSTTTLTLLSATRPSRETTLPLTPPSWAYAPAQASVSRITSKALIFIITLLGYLPM